MRARRSRLEFLGVCCLLAYAVARRDTRAAEPSGYYDAAAGLKGTALRAALHEIIDEHQVTSYSASRGALEVLDQDPANSANVILLYERASYPKAQFISTHPNGWNREHCWPNSLGIDNALPAYSDLFNLRACGEPANSDRANLPYEESATTAGGYQKPAGPTTPLCSQDLDSWEPPTEMKGDLARAMFYMDVRYEGDSGEPNLVLTDDATQISSSANFMGRLSNLLVWHFLDPVSAAERSRMEGVYGYQRNRNPFVDRPEWVEAIYGAVFELDSVLEGNVLVLSWPAIVPLDLGFIESSTDLVQWSRLEVPLVEQNGRHTARVPVEGPARFYRLRLQERTG